MKSNETYLNQEVHEYKRLIVSGFNGLAVDSIAGTEAQQCTDVPGIDLSLAPDLKTANDISKSILIIMDNKVLDIVAGKVFAQASCSKRAYNKGLEVRICTKYPFMEDSRSTRPIKEDDDKWYYYHVLEATVVDRSTGHTVFAIEFTVLGGYILKNGCVIHLFTKHLEEQVAFIMPYLEKGIKDYLKTKRDSV